MLFCLLDVNFFFMVLPAVQKNIVLPIYMQKEAFRLEIHREIYVRCICHLRRDDVQSRATFSI